MQALVQAAKAPKVAAAPRNVKVSVEGTELVLRVDMTQDLGPSSTGKTNLIASGTAKVPGFEGRAGFSLNVYYK
jgi:hypothetical protein